MAFAFAFLLLAAFCFILLFGKISGVGVELLLLLLCSLLCFFASSFFWAKSLGGGVWSLSLRSFTRLFFAVKMNLLYVQKWVRVCDESLKIRGFKNLFLLFFCLKMNTATNSLSPVIHYSFLIDSMILLVSSTGFSARRMVPLRAMPVTPVCRMAGMSSRVIPPMATMGRWMPSAFIRCTMER